MLLKILVLIAMAVYANSQGEPTLAVAFLLGLIPNVGLLITILNIVLLLFKGWYGSAAILGGLIAFNLYGNAYMDKQLTVSNSEDEPKRSFVESWVIALFIAIMILAVLDLTPPAEKVPEEVPAEETRPAEEAYPQPTSEIDWSSAPIKDTSSEPSPPVAAIDPYAEIGVKKNTTNKYLLKYFPKEYQAEPTLQELVDSMTKQDAYQRHQSQLEDQSSLSKKKFRRNVASSNGCESGHWVDSVSDDGGIVKLEDGSIWEVAAVDTVDSMLWLPTTDITVCDDKLINTEDNETVEVTRLK